MKVTSKLLMLMVEVPIEMGELKCTAQMQVCRHLGQVETHNEMEDEIEFDYLCIFDRIFANLLGIYILYLYPNNITFVLLITICFLFLFIQTKCQSSKNQSFLHGFIHILVCMILIVNNQ